MWFLLFTLFLIGSAVEGKDYTVIVKTAGRFSSGTDAQVKIRVQGTKGNIREREIRGRFEVGRTDRIYFQLHDIGHITGMDIRRDNAGFSPNWKLDKIIIRVSGAEDSIFNYYAWVPANRWIKLPLSCPTGFSVSQQHYCSDVNECLTGAHQCEQGSTTCSNQPGSYSCKCKNGYVSGQSPYKCEDVNECLTGAHKCEQDSTTCSNQLGSYSCKCKKGYLPGQSLYKCEMFIAFKKCNSSEPLGMESGKVSNQSITASSHYVGFPPWKARLNTGSANSWYGRPNDPNPWIQVDLTTPAWLKGVATQGKMFTLFVKTYKLAYSTDGVKWFTYKEPDGKSDKVFKGNTDPYRAVKVELHKPVYALYVRLYPKTWNHGITLKLELYGCRPH